MDREQLRQQALARRSQAPAGPARVQWGCPHCSRAFAGEGAFMGHRCRERERLEELRSVTGQAAYGYYSEWMRLKKRTPPPIETFGASRQRGPFVKFAEHAARVHMPAPLAFVRMMVREGLQPSLWCRDNVYALYVRRYDEAVPPEQQFSDSLDLALALAAEHGVPPAGVFGALGVGGLLGLLQRRRISPWFLVASRAFRSYMAGLGEPDRDRLEAAVQVGAMVLRIREDRESGELFALFARVCEAEGL